jgi:molybdenum cofactor cytidylyltransferase
VNTRYAAVVLAGGLSSRMKQFKPLLPLGEATVTDHVIGTFLNANLDVFLVAGYRHDEIKAKIKNRDFTFVYNPDYEHGMFSSVQSGVRRLQPAHKAFFIIPVDIPLVRPETVSRLMEAAAENSGKIIYPVFGGRRGHPPLIPSGLIPVIQGWGKGGGLKAVLKTQAKLALEVPVADGNILLDMDTPEDYRRILERFRNYEIPTDEECGEILNTICHVPTDRIRHNVKVSRVAVNIGKALERAGHNLDIELVKTAALLHDIAKGRPKHDIVGGRLLRELGFCKVGDIVAAHSTLAEGNTGLPLEVKIVFLADKFVGGEKLVSIEERYHHPDWPPESQKLSLERRKVAEAVKREFEDILGRPLEEVISGADD